jgi:hypothetical protein
MVYSHSNKTTGNGTEPNMKINRIEEDTEINHAAGATKIYIGEKQTFQQMVLGKLDIHR